jgi:hypothetical protein
MTEHILKCWPNAYDAVASGIKRFEWRKDDRGFEVGDVLVLRKWDPSPRPGCGVIGYVRQRELTIGAVEYTDQRVRVTYILRGMFGIPEGYCVMSIERMESI